MNWPDFWTGVFVGGILGSVYLLVRYRPGRRPRGPELCWFCSTSDHRHDHRSGVCMTPGCRCPGIFPDGRRWR